MCGIVWPLITLSVFVAEVVYSLDVATTFQRAADAIFTGVRQDSTGSPLHDLVHKESPFAPSPARTIKLYDNPLYKASHLPHVRPPTMCGTRAQLFVEDICSRQCNPGVPSPVAPGSQNLNEQHHGALLPGANRLSDSAPYQLFRDANPTHNASHQVPTTARSSKFPSPKSVSHAVTSACVACSPQSEKRPTPAIRTHMTTPSDHKVVEEFDAASIPHLDGLQLEPPTLEEQKSPPVSAGKLHIARTVWPQLRSKFLEVLTTEPLDMATVPQCSQTCKKMVHQWFDTSSHSAAQGSAFWDSGHLLGRTSLLLSVCHKAFGEFRTYDTCTSLSYDGVQTMKATALSLCSDSASFSASYR